MTLRLILTRHAKSSWDDPRVDDHDRPLNARGYEAAKAIGAWLAKDGYCPEIVVSSTAQRTMETWAEIAKSCNRDAKVQFTSSLYLASPDQMLATLKNCKGGSVMVLGHNPGTAMLATALVKAAPPHPKFAHYPTATTTVIDFDVDSWADVTFHSGRVEAFVVPRDLIG